MMISGEAVNGLTRMFLEMWEISNSKKKKFSEPAALSGAERFFGFAKYEPNGITVPFGDSPLYNYSAGEAAYLNIINGAEEYIWISTPYLILDYEMVSALTLASRDGVDVKIIVPAVPDKKYVQMVTRQNYRVLLDSDIEIYEFAPGFIHSKLIVADGKHAVIGSINFDFQSFHMLFESGAYMYKTTAVAEIAEDLSATFLKSKRIYGYDKNRLRQFFPKLIKLLSPFM
jgi:cardiolipin synthase